MVVIIADRLEHQRCARGGVPIRNKIGQLRKAGCHSRSGSKIIIRVVPGNPNNDTLHPCGRVSGVSHSVRP